jgi:hypothetical protein
MTEHNLLICDCGYTGHQMIIATIQDDDCAYVHIQLNPRPFHKRLWIAIKYLFGYKSPYGVFEEVVLTKRHVPQLTNVINHLNSSDVND